MGKYINIGLTDFQSVRKDKYVDKSMLISYVNSVLGTQRKFLFVMRARRFGKSIATKMLDAYYDESVDANELFRDLKIAAIPSYKEHLNKYPVIYLDASGFTAELKSDRRRVVLEMNNALSKELLVYNKSVECAVKQIKDKQYVEALRGYVGDIILVGINYDKRTKKHVCLIERISDKTSDKLCEIVAHLRDNSGIIDQVTVARMFEVSDRQARNYLTMLVEQGRVIRLGSNKNRKYQLRH